LLDGIATSAIAWIAGADLATAVRLGLAMVSLQASIGALNDLVDAPTDAGRKPGKPIPAGIVSARAARIVVAAGGGLGLLLTAPSGVAAVGLAAGILAIGYTYDLWAKGTAWSWLPFAVGIPLLPVFGWFGASGRLPGAFGLLLPAAFAAGAALAIANARADLERDAEGGVDSVAIRLGMGRAWLVEAVLLAAVAVVAIATLWLRAATPAAVLATVGATAVILSGLAVGRRGAAPQRQRAWELEAIGVAGLAAAWLAGVGGLT
jgi:4-hydroxybenzoate polyprenyltransferase